MSLSTRIIQIGILGGIYVNRRAIAESWHTKTPSSQQIKQADAAIAAFKQEGVKSITINHYRFGTLTHNGSSFFSFSTLPVGQRILTIENKPNEFLMRVRKV
jgi:hypothetical protein